MKKPRHRETTQARPCLRCHLWWTTTTGGQDFTFITKFCPDCIHRFITLGRLYD